MGAEAAAKSIATFSPHAIFRRREVVCVVAMPRNGAEL